MKMIASTRLIKAQRNMDVSKRYGVASTGLFFFSMKKKKKHD